MRDVVDDALGVAVAAFLQICILQKVPGVQIVRPFSVHLLGAGVRRSRLGGEDIGRDHIVPETEADENVRWHVLGVRNRGRQLRVTTRRVERQRSELRLIVGVDDVMEQARMRRILRDEGKQNRIGALLLGESGIAVRSRGNDGEAVEDFRFVVSRKFARHVSHCVAIGVKPFIRGRRVGRRLRFDFVVLRQRIDVSALARSR